MRSIVPFPCAPLATTLTLIAAVGCAPWGLPHEEGSEIEQVSLEIAAVPAEVACVRVTAVGPGRTLVREVDVKPGETMTESFGGLPPGMVVFKAEAFATTCEPVTKSTIPSWVSEEETVTVAIGRLSSLSLVMHRNGRAKVAVSFADERLADGGVDADY